MTIISGEVLRRLALLVALPIGTLMIAWPAPRLLGLSGVDWEVERGHEIAAVLSKKQKGDTEGISVLREMWGVIVPTLCMRR